MKVANVGLRGEKKKKKKREKSSIGKGRENACSSLFCFA